MINRKAIKRRKRKQAEAQQRKVWEQANHERNALLAAERLAKACSPKLPPHSKGVPPKASERDPEYNRSASPELHSLQVSALLELRKLFDK